MTEERKHIEEVLMIKKRIKLLGVKKSHVAEKAGLKPSELSHFLSRRRRMSDDKLFALKKYLGL
jgi:plasmid maintenance system antidote protein VapI